MSKSVRSILETMALFAPDGEGMTVQSPCITCGAMFDVPPDVKRLPPLCPVCRLGGSETEQWLERRWARMDVPKAFQDAEWQTFQLHGRESSRSMYGLALQTARGWSRDSGKKPFLVLLGEPGCGKTRLAWTIVRAMLSTATTEIQFHTLPDFVQTVRETWKRHGEHTELAITMQLRNLHVLVVDDVSSDKWPPNAERELWTVLNTRNDYRRPTIITSNENVETFYDLIGPSLASRILQCGEIITLPKEDYRSE